ncbi:MAG: AraC family transcriptional regulator [Pseudomonadales bacterium]
MSAENGTSASVPAVKQYLRTAESCGVDYFPLLQKAGIDAALLADNNARVSNHAMERLIGYLTTACNDPCLGLHSAQFVEPATYSVLGYISMNCANLREVLANIPVFEKIVGDMGVSSTEPLGDCVLLSWHCQFLDDVARRQEVEAVIASWNAYTRNFLHVEPEYADAVWFEHSAPDDRDLIAEYRDFFACEVLFEQRCSGIVIKNDVLEKPLPQRNEMLLQTLLDHATQLLADLDRDQPMTVQVKNMLRLMLTESAPSSALIADKLGVSARTLQRRLLDEDTYYKDVLNELRLEMAMHYLQSTTLSLDRIATKLGYAEPRSFYRSFKQWTGQTAGSFRADVQED